MLVLKSKFLICCSEEVYEDHALVIEGETVKDILPNVDVEKRYPEARCIDKSDCIVSPGFINAHMHQYGVIARGIPVEVQFKDFREFLWDYWWPYIEDRLGLEEVEVTAQASAIELIRSGVIGFCDVLEAPNTEEGTLVAQAKILEQIGIKAILSLESSERISTENGLRCIEENSRFIDWSRKYSKLAQGMICTHTTFTCSDKFLKLAQKKAGELNALWHFHLSESSYEVDFCLKNYHMPPVEYLEHLGLLGGPVLASQCVKVDKREVEILKEREVRVVHVPLSNCEVGGGFSPVPDFLESGITVALGTDGFINDFFQVMKAAFLLHKAVKEDTTVMPAATVFKMATEYGAQALGWRDSGKLKPGYKADAIVMKMGFKTPVTRQNIFDQIVVHGDKEFIDSVYVNGKAILREGRLTTIDEEAVVKEMKNAARKFWESKGEGLNV